MITAKGLYEWKLLDADNNVLQEGSQWNVCSDHILKCIVASEDWSTSNRNHLKEDYMYINLSDSTTTPGVDYRRAGASKFFNMLAEIGPGLVSHDDALGYIRIEGSFNPGGVRTIRIIGVSLGSFTAFAAVPDRYFQSFIELSTPITQTTLQHLYVKYTLYVAYTSGGYNVPSNRYLERGITQGIITGSPLVFGNTYQANSTDWPILRPFITYFRPPSNINKCMRLVTALWWPVAPTDFGTNQGGFSGGSYVGRIFFKSFTVAQIPGAIGAICFVSDGYVDAAPVPAGTGWWSRSIVGYSQVKDMAPSISRVFLHIATRLQIIFRDDSYPPTGFGTTTITGTPTNKAPIVARLHITKTGDASDIIDETFLPAAVSVANNTMQLTQAFGIGDIVRFTNSGGALPSPLVISTDYYVTVAYLSETFLPAAVNTGTEEITTVHSFVLNDVVRFTNSGGALPTPIVADTDYYVIQAGTTIKVSTAKSGSTIDISDQGTGTHTILLQATELIIVSLSSGGSPVDIADQGTGTHTIIRQNTGEYHLELDAWATAYTTSVPYFVNQLPMGIDIDNKVMPHLLSSAYDTGEGGVTTVSGNIYSSSMIRAHAKVGDYIYTVQQSRNGLVHNMCRWNYWTIETSEALCKFGNASTTISAMVSTGTVFYIGTNDGIYRYNTATPSTAPALITVTGIINTTIKDLAYDTVTGYLWSGHSTGLSKIDLGALTATQYTTASGLTGMVANDINIWAGQLDAYNGIVLRCGIYKESGSYLNYADWWILQDGVGWVKNTTDAMCGCLRKGTNQVVVSYATGGTVNVFRCTYVVTGMGTGTITAVETFTNATSATPGPQAQMVQMSDVEFLYYVYLGSFSNSRAMRYIVGGSLILQDISSVFANYETAGYGYDQGWAYGQIRNLIDINGNGVNTTLWHGWLYCLYASGVWPSYQYGWPTSSWVKDSAVTRRIPKTGTHVLLDGLSVAFNNKTGKTYDQQFVSGERYTFMYGPTKIKDDLQTMDAKAVYYHGKANAFEAVAVTVPASDPRSYHITQKSDPDFRDMDWNTNVTEVYEGATRYTVYNVGTTNRAFTASAATDILTYTSLAIATGTPLLIANYSVPPTPPWPLWHVCIYYAINVSATQCKLALTYADAIAGTAIDLTTAGTPGAGQYLYPVIPTTGTYYGSNNGIFVFSAADAGKNLTLTYTVTYFT